MSECWFEKNPLYRRTINKKLIEFFSYKGYLCYIVTMGAYPLAYVVNKNCKFGKYLAPEQLNKLDVHGGITYNSDELYVNEVTVPLKFEQIIGWDYAHAGDLTIFPSIDGYTILGKIWTIKEIEEECRNVVDQIIAMEVN